MLSSIFIIKLAKLLYSVFILIKEIQIEIGFIEEMKTI